MVKTELSLSFTVDISRPLPETERALMREALDVARRLRQSRGPDPLALIDGAMALVDEPPQQPAHAGNGAVAAPERMSPRVAVGREEILAALERAGGVVALAARELNWNSGTLRNRMAALGIVRQRVAPSWTTNGSGGAA